MAREGWGGARGRADEEAEERGPRPRRAGGPPWQTRRRVCPFCAERASYIDYKNADFLSRFLSDRGRIRGRRRTSACAKHQRKLSVALKRARHLALLPFAPKHVRGR